VYFVVTQDDALANSLRARPYVPLFRLVRAVLLLESPLSASRNYTSTIEQSKFTSMGWNGDCQGMSDGWREEHQMVGAIKRKDPLKRQDARREEQKILQKRSRDELGGAFSNRKKKKAKGPNPLSHKIKKGIVIL
jgi:hypothetical protein